MAEGDENKKSGMDRRALLTGAAGGAAIAGAGAAGLFYVDRMRRKLVTPAEVEAGKPPEVAETLQDSRPAYLRETKAAADAPNIIVVVLDDVGFADLGCYGSEIATPAFDALAASGLRYSNFRTCAMCSPTRAALMTGLNHHSAALGWIAELDSGFPGYRGDMTQEAATIAEVLVEAGWSTIHVGKWHVNVAHSTGANGPYHNWPTHRGFERAYWFQGHSTDYFKPAELIDGTAPVEAPVKDDYYVNDDLTDRAIAFINTQKALDPEKPFYMQLCFPAAHSPLQTRPRDRDAHKGKYDAGWDAVRQQRLDRQKAMGLIPATTTLPPLAPGVSPWDKLTAEERALFARYMEVYAGLITNLDQNLGRVLRALELIGQRENTLIMVISDNGGSAEGTQTGTPNVFAAALGRPVPVADAAKLAPIMGEDPTFPHYPIGWTCVSNTPFRLYKQYAHLGGVADPLIVSWPKRITETDKIRDRFVHVVDLYPTILEAAGVKRPDTYHGRKLKPIEGASIVATFADAAAKTRPEQYFELGGQRAYLDGNWRLVTRHDRGSDYANDKWELYDLSADFNEMQDLSAKHPEKVAELKAKWEAAAQRYNVYPLDDRNLVIKMAQDRQRRGLKPSYEIRPPIERLGGHVAPFVCGFSHEIAVEIKRPAGGGDGVLIAHGSKHAGYVLHILKGKLVYEQSLAPWLYRIEAAETLPEGDCIVRYVQTMTSRPFEGSGAIFVGAKKLAERKFEHALMATSYDGFTVGADLGNQVSTLYQGTNPFQGTIERIAIKVDNTPFSALETMRFINAIGIKI